MELKRAIHPYPPPELKFWYVKNRSTLVPIPNQTAAMIFCTFFGIQSLPKPGQHCSSSPSTPDSQKTYRKYPMPTRSSMMRLTIKPTIVVVMKYPIDVQTASSPQSEAQICVWQGSLHPVAGPFIKSLHSAVAMALLGIMTKTGMALKAPCSLTHER